MTSLKSLCRSTAKFAQDCALQPISRRMTRLHLQRRKTRIAAEINGKNVVKEIYVPGKLVNIVVKG